MSEYPANFTAGAIRTIEMIEHLGGVATRDELDDLYWMWHGKRYQGLTSAIRCGAVVSTRRDGEVAFVVAQPQEE